MTAPFIGEISFVDHVQKILEMPQVTAHLMTLPAISVLGHTLETLTEEVDQKMREGLIRLQRKVLKRLPEPSE